MFARLPRPAMGAMGTIAVLIGMLVFVTGAQATTYTYEGHGTSTGDSLTTVTFDAVYRNGKPRQLKNVEVDQINYDCDNGAEPTGSFDQYSFIDPIAVSKKRKFSADETEPIPGWDASLAGSISKTGKVTGGFFVQWGFEGLGHPRNCHRGGDFKARRV